uniref:U11/U12 small nuclear ribonucleoprotein n=1 Tax=Anthurium amnicola TaxID=1678845 RepID=A0A1D1Y5Y6_9ARAE
MKEGGVGIRVGFSHKHRGGPLSALPGRSTKWEEEGRELPGLCVLMPIIIGMEEVPRRRSASEASHWKPRRPSTLPQERRRLVEHARSRSFSNFELVLDDGGDGGCGDGRKQSRNRREQQQQQQEQRRSRDQRRRPNHQARVADVGCGGVGVGFRRWSSFSYYRLPEHRLRLTIVKLDSSSFDVQVMRSASISDLKLAVEEIFTRSPKGEGEISWFHVWGHFCLCYKDQKLIDNKVSLKTFGIKDGDEAE